LHSIISSQQSTPSILATPTSQTAAHQHGVNTFMSPPPNATTTVTTNGMDESVEPSALSNDNSYDTLHIWL
jgi:hypothetical protein